MVIVTFLNNALLVCLATWRSIIVWKWYRRFLHRKSYRNKHNDKSKCMTQWCWQKWIILYTHQTRMCSVHNTEGTLYLPYYVLIGSAILLISRADKAQMDPMLAPWTLLSRPLYNRVTVAQKNKELQFTPDGPPLPFFRKCLNLVWTLPYNYMPPYKWLCNLMTLVTTVWSKTRLFCRDSRLTIHFIRWILLHISIYIMQNYFWHWSGHWWVLLVYFRWWKYLYYLVSM